MTQPSAPPDLSLWSLHCFCLGARSTPHRIIRLDNNGELLHSAVGGTTVEGLERRGLKVTASQLALLETYGLISLDGDHVETLFPVLGPAAVEVIRTAAERVAMRAVPRVEAQAGRIVAELDRHRLGDHGHAIVFGHALDGVIWGLLADRGGIPDVTLGLSSPYWRGVFWALYPGRVGSAGTNELPGEGATLVMVWDDGSAARLGELASNLEMKDGFGSLDPTASRHVLPEVGSVPIVEVGGVLDEVSRDLAQAIVELMPTPEESLARLDEAGVAANVEAATVIVAHEIIWAVTDLFGDSGVVTRPSGTGVEGRLFVRLDG